MMTSVGSAGKAIVFGGVGALAMALAACSSAQSSGSAAAEGTAAGGTAVGGQPAGDLRARDVLRVADGAKRADGQRSVP